MSWDGSNDEEIAFLRIWIVGPSSQPLWGENEPERAFLGTAQKLGGNLCVRASLRANAA